MKLGLYCTCGAAWFGELSGKASAKVLKMWDETHSGEGHKGCDRATATRARNAAERKETKEDRP